MTTDILTDNTDPVAVDPSKDYYAELVGEGRKFRDNQALARGKYEADMLVDLKIKQYDDLMKDYTKLREDYNARAKLEELIDQMQPKPASSDFTPPAKEVVQQPTMDPNQIKNLVVEEIQKTELTRRQTENANEVKAKLIERYGNNYASTVKSQLEDLGISQDLFNSLAANNPKLLYRSLGLDAPVQPQMFEAPPRTNQNTGAFIPKGAEKRTWSWYQDLKRTNPNLYATSKIQSQMIQDYQAQGSTFEDGDFHSR